MNKVWNDFMSSKYAQEALAELDKKAGKINKKAQAAYSTNMDRNKLYDVGPGMEPAMLGQSVETMGVSGGGGSMVGSEDSKFLYTMKTAPVQGGQEDYADGVVEGLEDRHQQMMDVAMKAPTGKPFGDQGNASLKWDGIAAAGKAVKPFAKRAQGGPNLDPGKVADFMKGFGGAHEMANMEPSGMMGGSCMMDHDHGDGSECMEELDDKLGEHGLGDLDSFLDEESQEHEHGGHDGEESDQDLDSLLHSASTRDAKKVRLLSELVKIANELDLEGAHEEADEVDAVIKTEVAALKKKMRK